MKFLLYKLNFLFAVLIISIQSCSKVIKCSDFEYDNFGLDTLLIKKNQVLRNAGDSIIIKVIKCEIVNLKEDIESPIKVAECNNGVTIEYTCDYLNFFFTNGFNLKENGYNYMIVSPYFDMQILNIKKMSEINMSLTKFEENNGKKTRIKSMEIKNGYVFKIIDINNRVWN